MENFDIDERFTMFLREYNRIFAYPTKTTATFVYKVDPETGIEPESNEFGIDSIMITGSFLSGKTITGRDFDLNRDLLFAGFLNGIDISKISNYGDNLSQILEYFKLYVDRSNKMDYSTYLTVRPFEHIDAMYAEPSGLNLSQMAALSDMGERDEKPTYAYEYLQNGNRTLILMENFGKSNTKTYDIYLEGKKKKVYYNTKTKSTIVPF